MKIIEMNLKLIMITEETAQRIERKLDTILDAMGLTDNHRLAPAEAESIATGIVLQFQKKRGTTNDNKAGN